jgi:arabinogalactan oligomer/maltooligosaccharide transport system substrate-binding protein
MTGQQKRIGWLAATALAVALILASCGNERPEDKLKGRITLWHSWTEAEAAVLGEALAEYQELHPEVRVIPVALPQDQLLEEFIDAGIDGLGPGLLIGKDNWIGELVNGGLIQPLFPVEAENALFTSRNRALTEYEGDVYGVPLFLAPRALYYNKDLVSEPAENLEALLEDASAGKRLAFVPRFEAAYWGIQAFGAGLFDSQDRFTLAGSGFAEWLVWLAEAQSSPGVILNVDDASLLELFASQQIAYYVGGPEKQAEIMALMDEEDRFEYGVAPLPNGPGGPAGPLLPAETLLIYAFTSDMQTRIATSLSYFLVNQQQSVRFMREMDRVPANPAVSVDRRIYPVASGFARQAQSAVFIPNEVPTNLLTAAGDRAYISVLSGLLTPAEAVCRFGQEVAAFQDYAAAEMSLPEGCEPLE